MQHFALLSTLILVATFSIIFVRDGMRVHETMSDHVSEGRHRPLYIFGSLVSYTLLTMYALFWMIDQYDLPLAANFMFILSAASFLVTTFVPRLGHIKSLVHDASATITGFSVWVVTLLLIYSSNADDSLRTILIAFFIVGNIFGLPILNRNKRHYSVYQITCYMVIYAMFIVLAYYPVSG